MEVLMLQVVLLNSTAYFFFLTFWLFLELSPVILLVVFFRVLTKCNPLWQMSFSMHDSKGKWLIKLLSLLCLVLKKKQGQTPHVILVKTDQTSYSSTKVTL